MLALVIGCATGIHSSGYTIIQGTLKEVPIIDSHEERLTFYLTDADGLIMIAIAENKENFELLEGLHQTLAGNEATVYLFCREADSEWREYVDGSVDYEVFGIGYYDYFAKRYVTVVTTYGNTFTDVLKSQDWASFTTGLLKKGIGAAL